MPPARRGCAATAAHTDPVDSRMVAITVPSSMAAATVTGMPSSIGWPG